MMRNTMLAWRQSSLRCVIRNMWENFYPIFEENRRRKRKAWLHWVHQQMGTAWNKWRLDYLADKRIRELRALNAKAAQAILRMQGAKVVQAFQRWQEWLADLARQKAFLQGAVRRMQNMKLSKGWEKWQEWYAEIMHERALLARGIGRMLHRQLGMAVGRWVEWYSDIMEQRRKLELYSQRWIHRAVIGALNRWQEWYQDFLHHLQVLNQAMARWRKGAISRAWNQWMFYAEGMRLARAGLLESEEEEEVVSSEDEEFVPSNNNNAFALAGTPRDFRQQSPRRTMEAREMVFNTQTEEYNYSGSETHRTIFENTISSERAEIDYERQATVGDFLIDRRAREEGGSEPTRPQQMREKRDRHFLRKRDASFNKWVHDDFAAFCDWTKGGGETHRSSAATPQHSR